MPEVKDFILPPEEIDRIYIETPICKEGLAENIKDIMRETARLQLDRVLKHRFDRPELRRKILKALTADGIVFSWDEEMADQILVLRPTEEETRQDEKKKIIQQIVDMGHGIQHCNIISALEAE